MRFANKLLCLALIVACMGLAAPPEYFRITVVDDVTGRGVPLVELRTTNDVRYFTDSAGVVAFDDAGLMDQTVFFGVSSHGYSFPKDGFGYSGAALKPVRGGSAVIKIHRVNIAERLYRITGEGIYRDSIMLGDAVPTKQPLLNGKVMGQDTVEVVPYKGKIYWFWGDTGRPAYPLGNFHTSGATSLMPEHGGVDPDRGIDLSYFVDADGFCKAMLPRSEPGPVWVGGLATVRDDAGAERLITNWARVRSLSDVAERGLAVFDDAKQEFIPTVPLDRMAPQCPLGHPFHATVDGTDYLYSSISEGDPFPFVRVPADMRHITDAGTYESYTCLVAGSHYQGADTKLDRDATGRLHYAWKRTTPALDMRQERELVRAGKMKPEEALLQLRDSQTGAPIQTAEGSVYWNSYRKRWVMITGQKGGTSLLGEIWYAEADTPVGPWLYAVKVVSHNDYTFYNPTQHPFFDQDGGRRIYFEGTYTKTFTNNKDVTPRYDYNQIMYRLSLDDPRLTLPAPIYLAKIGTSTRLLTKEGVDAARAWDHITEIPFFAIPPNRAHAGMVPIYDWGNERQGRAIQTPLFYALPPDSPNSGHGDILPLYRITDDRNGAASYGLTSDDPHLKRSEKPIGCVWRNPRTTLDLDLRTKPADGLQ